MLAALLLRDYREDRSARAILFFLVCSIGNALMPLFPVERTGAFLAETLFLLSSLVAPSFWVLAKVHFDDDFRLGNRHLALRAFGPSWAGAAGASSTAASRSPRTAPPRSSSSCPSSWASSSRPRPPHGLRGDAIRPGGEPAGSATACSGSRVPTSSSSSGRRSSWARPRRGGDRGDRPRAPSSIAFVLTTASFRVRPELPAAGPARRPTHRARPAPGRGGTHARGGGTRSSGRKG